jgi:hypothetical protein
MLRKIADLPHVNYCRNPEHNPPNMIVLPPGVYEHTCPGCGHVSQFVVPKGPMYSMSSASSADCTSCYSLRWYTGPISVWGTNA